MFSKFKRLDDDFEYESVWNFSGQSTMNELKMVVETDARFKWCSLSSAETKMLTAVPDSYTAIKGKCAYNVRLVCNLVPYEVPMTARARRASH